MSNKEKLPKLVDVYRPSSTNPLCKRQLPLTVEDNLTLIMDLKGSGIVCDNPLVRGKELEEFTKKWSKLSEEELKASVRISRHQLLDVLNQNVPCVGCRRSVERLYLQLFKFGHPTLEPLIVTKEGVITIQEEKCLNPQTLCTLFHDHAARLDKLIENQPKRNKKSLRCLLHSLDSQRSRPLSPVWRDVWDCMRPDCKKEVCIIEAPTLHATLETYLRKHRFCGECRTKVLKAYYLLVEEPEPCKEKGYVASLYAGIKRCLPDKHIHLQTKTDYITKLIMRAEPELLGSRRERHAKTLEIAQEEVLTCLGICMYERLHRIYMKMREEECTCQVFAAVAVDTLCRNFETAVEHSQGVSQLELLYEELAKEEQLKLIRKEQKKIKRKRKKGKISDRDSKENNCEDCGDEEDYDEKVVLDDSICVCGFSCDQLNLENGLSRNNRHSVLYDCAKCCNGNIISENNCVPEEEEDEEMWIEECKCGDDGNKTKKVPFRCDNYNRPSEDSVPESKKDGGGSSSDHSHDCGYSSENNNGCCETGSLVSSLSTSPEGSELACSDTCCQLETDYFKSGCGANGLRLSLQEMLDENSDDDDDNCFITPEEVTEFKNNNRQVLEKRKELRETLRNRFAQFCVNGPLQVPRLTLQSKYVAN